jgi:serine protease Do
MNPNEFNPVTPLNNSWKKKLRDPRVLSGGLVLATLAVGILIGTLVRTDVLAQKNGPATDATPLKIPSPVQMATEFTALAKKLEPAVVNIQVQFGPPPTSAAQRRRSKQAQPEDPGAGDEQSDLFERFFGGQGGGQQRAPRGGGEGSGFIVDPKGYIITNNHVVEKATSIKVKLYNDPTEYKARLIGTDTETDLAVIKVDLGRELPITPIGNSDAVQVGDWAVAIGSPLGLEATVTAGIISALGRDVPNSGRPGQTGQFQKFLQTDAAINPGNSGGPLLNIRGEVIGVNTAIATQSGGYQGIGFALPSNTMVGVYNQIVDRGKVTRGSIGINFSKMEDNPQLYKALGVDHGVIVGKVTEGGPASVAGVEAEDVITAIDGKPVKGGDDMVARIADTPIGTKVTITVDRAGKKLNLPVTIGDRNVVFSDLLGTKVEAEAEALPGSPAEGKFGIRVRDLNAQEKVAVKGLGGGGVAVADVNEDSFAEEVGMESGDVILSINRVPVNSIDDIRKVQSTLKPGDAVAFRVARMPQPTVRGGPSGAAQTFYLAGTLPKN